jgi:hypothetical protein
MRSITDVQAFTILETWFSQDMDKQRFFRAFCYAYVKKNIPYNAFKKTDYDYIYSLKRSADATPAALAYIKFQQSHLPVAPNLGQDANLEQEQEQQSQDVNLEQEQEQQSQDEDQQSQDQDQQSQDEDQQSQDQDQDELYQQLETIIQSQNTIIQVLFLILFIVGLPIITDNIDIVYALLYPNKNCRPLLPY